MRNEQQQSPSLVNFAKICSEGKKETKKQTKKKLKVTKFGHHRVRVSDWQL